MITYTLYFLYIFGVSPSYSYNLSNALEHNSQGIIPRVYNGWPATLGDVPYQVSFKKPYRRHLIFASFCGGVIVGPSKLLSAAHCFVKTPRICDRFYGVSGIINQKTLTGTFAVAGQLSNIARHPGRDSLEGGQWRRLMSVHYPPPYKFPKLDFALVFLLNPFSFDNYVNAIPYASRHIDYNGKCLVSGFGRTTPRKDSDKLLLAHLTLLTMTRCNRKHRMSMRHFVCTSSQYTDVGKGDSGGPLVCANTGDPKESSKGVLVGIVSGHAYHIGSFFTRVSSYYRFIERNKSCTEKNIYLHLTFLINLIHWRFLLF